MSGDPPMRRLRGASRPVPPVKGRITAAFHASAPHDKEHRLQALENTCPINAPWKWGIACNTGGIRRGDPKIRVE